MGQCKVGKPSAVVHYRCTHYQVLNREGRSVGLTDGKTFRPHTTWNLLPEELREIADAVEQFEPKPEGATHAE